MTDFVYKDKISILKEEIITHIKEENKKRESQFFKLILGVSVALFISTYVVILIQERCLLQVNLLMWEFSRPKPSCDYCKDSEPIILHNVTRESFKEYAYSSKPIIVKGAIDHWKARKYLNYDLLKNIFESNFEHNHKLGEFGQYLSFQTKLFSIEDVFTMSKERAANTNHEESWYVGWQICKPKIIAAIREYYSYPEFLPEDAEFPNCDTIFFGYEIGAITHLDYIARLMWQGQVQGHKIWTLNPVPECEKQCQPFEFVVDPGDGLLVDTRIWYHSTKIPKGEFSLTIVSEYG